MIPNFQAQIAHAADPESVASEVCLELDFPYHNPPQTIYLSVNRVYAEQALLEFHDVWMRFLEGRDNGCV